MSTPKHFLDIDQIPAEALQHMLRVAEQSRQNGRKPDGGKSLAGKTLAMIFEKPSTRTRVSFEIGMRQLGGEVVVLLGNDLQLGRGETVADTARVLSRYVDALMIRTDDPDKLTEIAEHASVPVINGLTDRSHPCQVLADIVTYQQHRGPIKGRRVAWSGDGNNVAVSWIHAAQRFQFELVLACPPAYAPLDSEVNWACQSGAKVSVVTDPHAAVRDADCVVTDTWVSMSDKDEAARRRTLPPYQVNQQLMALAKSDSLFMHCLPAHRGEEVTDEVIDGPHSVVWDEAENRVHAQKAILDWCLGE